MTIKIKKDLDFRFDNSNILRPRIEVDRKWSIYDIKRFLSKNKRLGNTYRNKKSDYQMMLHFVSRMEPTVEHLYIVASDIYDHTEGEKPTIPCIMTLLENAVVKTEYRIYDHF